MSADARRTYATRRAEAAQLIDSRSVEILDVMGPTIQLLTLPEPGVAAPCLMRGTIPPGVFVPLHSHPDPETFVAISGDVEGLGESADGFRWIRLRPGDVFHVPSGAKHAFRNQSRETAVMLVGSTPRMGRFFREVGTPIAPVAPPPGPPTPETVRRFLEIAERYGYWNATPEENARVGITL